MKLSEWKIQNAEYVAEMKQLSSRLDELRCGLEYGLEIDGRAQVTLTSRGKHNATNGYIDILGEAVEFEQAREIARFILEVLDEK